MKQISIIGGGSWGTALAKLLALKGHQVLIHMRDKEQRDSINFKHYNLKYFPKHKLPQTIKATLDLKKAVDFASVIVLAVPTPVTREIISAIAPYLKAKQHIISTAKGIEEKTFLRNSEIIQKYTSIPLSILSGPSHAEEVINELPTAVVIASLDLSIAEQMQDLFMSPSFRVYTNQDFVGVELGGAIKNIIALAAGIVEGLGYGDNTKAALITRGLHEMSCLGVHLGGNPLTFSGLAGMGDLVVTCTSMHSRNRRFGIKIGQGLKLQEALSSIQQAVEGVRTTKAIYQWVKKQNIKVELPITNQVYQVLFQNKELKQAAEELMVRDPKQESDLTNFF